MVSFKKQKAQGNDPLKIATSYTEICFAHNCTLIAGFFDGLMVKNPQQTQFQSLGQEDSLKRKWQPIQYSCLENPMDREACDAIVHEVTNVRQD